MTDQTPLPFTPSEIVEVERLQIEQASADAAALAQSEAKVDLAFPVIGFIDPTEELAKLRQIVITMPEGEQRAYPELIRAKLLAHHADAAKNPPVSDEELALAIYLRRTTDTPLTQEDIEAKTTGKKKAPAVKEKKAAKPKADKTDDILKGLGL